MEEPVEKSLERYDVLDRIAVGGMAEVFLAKAYGAHGFEKTLAIKRILPELAKDPEFAARFIAEAKVAVRLSHANIVQVFDFGRIGESLFIAMEFVDGLDLAALLRKLKDEGRQVPLPAAFHIAIEIVRALDFAHSHNVVHRDVSPSNILLSRAGEVKIADFGIAVAAAPHKGGGPGPRKVMGKWRYMSPEQARGDTLDTRSDLFSAASVIFELFTGTKLFPGDEAEDIVKNIDTMPIPKLGTLRAGLPARLDDVLAGPLSRRPNDRPPRPASVLRSLIELSYESSIMATALDVAETVASALPPVRPSSRGAIDDVIRKQLADQPTAQRQTAVTDGKPPSTETAEGGDVSTGLFRKLDMDGLARLEEIDDTKVAAPRARRASGEVAALQPDTGIHALFSANLDRDRRTEVGGPPTGPAPKDLEPDAEPAAAPGTNPTTGAGVATPAAPRRALWAALVVVALGGAGAGVWVIARRSAEPPLARVVVSADAAVIAPATGGTIEIRTDPPGATGMINGSPLGAPTPVTASNIPPGNVTIHLELPGYQPLDYDLDVQADKTIVDRQRFVALPAALIVTTRPSGAQVTVDGRSLGTTPLTRRNLDAHAGATVTLALAGHAPQTFTIALAAGVTTTIERTLKAALRFANAQLRFTPGSVGWGDVFLGGRRLGRAPMRAVALPVGRVQLRFINDGAQPPVTWDATCEVTEAGPNICVITPP